MTESTNDAHYADLYPITVEFPEYGFHETWRSPQDILTYLEAHQNRWRWVQVQEKIGEFYRLSVHRILEDVKQRIQTDHFGYDHGVGSREKFAAAIKNHMEHSGPLLDDAFFQFVEKFRGIPKISGISGQEYAVVLVALALDFNDWDAWLSQIPGQTHRLTIAHIASVTLDFKLYKNGIAERADAETATLSRQVAEAKARVGELSSAWGSLEGQLNSASGEIGKILMDTNKQLEELKAAYRADQLMAEPQTYWEEKRVYHSSRSQAYMVATILSIFAMLFGLWEIASNVGPYLGVFNKYWHIYTALSVLTITVMAWGVRIFSRMHQIHAALGNDARERIAMAGVFVALTKLEQEGERSEVLRGIIYTALFRATPIDSAGKDDGAITTMPEIIAQKLRTGGAQL